MTHQSEVKTANFTSMSTTLMAFRPTSHEKKHPILVVDSWIHIMAYCKPWVVPFIPKTTKDLFTTQMIRWWSMVVVKYSRKSLTIILSSIWRIYL